jgi:hypothetical protein
MLHPVRLFPALFALLIAGVAAGERPRAVRIPPPPPLDSSILLATILEGGSLDLEPGATHVLRMYRWQCCWYTLPVAADVRFYTDPADFVTLDEGLGRLSLSVNAQPGSSFRVYADIEHGRRLISADVHVVSAAANPLLGYWRQIAEVPCDGTSDVPVVQNSISELAFSGDHKFTVTWFLLEVRKDYWGTYAFGFLPGRITFAIDRGNYIPTTFRGDGNYTITDNGGNPVLRITGMTFGRYSLDHAAPNCGAVFARSR